MSKASLNIAYTGPALEDGSMDVRELAPALLAIGELLERCNELLNPPESRIAVRVKAEFRRGSFEVLLELVQSMAEQMRMMLNMSDGVAAGDMLKMVGLTASSTLGVVKLLKELKGKRPDKVYQAEGNIIVLEKGDIRIEVPREVAQLYADSRVRESIKAVVEPVRRPGIESFEVRESGAVVQRVAKEEVTYFEAPAQIESPPGDVEVGESSRTAYFTIVGLSFEEGKWRLFDGETKLWATIGDAGFRGRIDRSEVAFRKGDQLRAELLTRQSRTAAGKLSVEHEIVQVLEHYKAPQQGELELLLEKTRDAG